MEDVELELVDGVEDYRHQYYCHYDVLVHCDASDHARYLPRVSMHLAEDPYRGYQKTKTYHNAYPRGDVVDGAGAYDEDGAYYDCVAQIDESCEVATFRCHQCLTTIDAILLISEILYGYVGICGKESVDEGIHYHRQPDIAMHILNQRCATDSNRAEEQECEQNRPFGAHDGSWPHEIEIQHHRDHHDIYQTYPTYEGKESHAGCQSKDTDTICHNPHERDARRISSARITILHAGYVFSCTIATVEITMIKVGRELQQHREDKSHNGWEEGDSATDDRRSQTTHHCSCTDDERLRVHVVD